SSDGGLTGLTVADDQLTLAPADGKHAVDGLDAGLEGLFNGLTVNNAGSGAFNGPELLGVNGACTIDGLAQGNDDTADHGFDYGNGYHPSGPLDHAALVDAHIAAQQNDGNAVFFQILGHSEFAVGKLQQFAGHALAKAAGPGNAVTYQDNGAGLVLSDGVFVMLDLAADDFGNFFRFQLHCFVTTTFFRC